MLEYGLNWLGKEQAITMATSKSDYELVSCKNESRDWDTTGNLYIEGDNLEVLKLLRKKYLNKIKMIYIDPPYNTGKKFVYDDNFTLSLKDYLILTKQNDKDNPETNGRFHVEWLNMIYPRLLVAKELLTDDGVIFISIGNKEFANLKLICDELFGEENYICEIIRKTGYGVRKDTKHISIENDYVLVYSKNKESLELNKQPLPHNNNYTMRDCHVGRRGNYQLRTLDAGSLTYSKTLDYPIIAPDGSEIYPGRVKENNGWIWRWNESKLKWGIENDFIEFKKVKNQWRVYTKIYEKVDNNNNPIKRTMPYTNILIDGVFTNGKASGFFKKLFGSNKYFNYPKPMELIYHLLKIGSDKNSIILDFFSGSATTAHAVMELNNDDGGNRKYIMVQIPEEYDKNSIPYKHGYRTISKMGRKRINMVGDELISKANNKKLDIGYKLFKLSKKE